MKKYGGGDPWSMVNKRPPTILESLSRKLLREAEEEEDDKKKKDDAGEGNDEKPSSDELNKGGVGDSVDARIDAFLNDVDMEGDFDPETFANHVARLVDHFDTLLDMRNIIIKRALNNVKGTHGDEAAENFEMALDELHGVVAGQSKWDREQERYAAPDNAEASGGSFGG